MLLAFSFHSQFFQSCILRCLSDFTRGPYGKGLYFSMQACQAAAFSAVNISYLDVLVCSIAVYFYASCAVS